MMQLVLLAYLLAMFTVSPEPATAASPTTQDLQKRIEEIDARLTEGQKLLKAADTRLSEVEKSLKATDGAAVMKSIDSHLQTIQSKLPDSAQWATFSEQLRGFARSMRKTSDAVALLLVGALVAAVASLIAGHVQQQRLQKAASDISDALKAVLGRRPPPTILAVEPSSGPTAGGKVVKIHGRNFIPGAAVRFKDSLATSMAPASSELIIVTTVAAQPGPCDVTVQNPDGGADTLRAAFTHRPSPVIRGVIPDAGPANTPITVFGANFERDSQIQINSANVSTTFGSENHLTCVVPAGQTGQVVVGVRNRDDQTDQTGRYTYQQERSEGADRGA